MIPLGPVPAHLLRLPPEKQNVETTENAAKDEASEKESDEEKFLLCRQCHQIITSPAERTVVQGSHQHTFANPHGIVYEIGCFRNVIGCGYAGPATDEFTWFSGFSWRVALCTLCLTHLGWRFVSPGGEGFSGLILDRLIDSEKI
ncbi:cereblon family protein [Thermodesulfobacteriota bacterium]